MGHPYSSAGSGGGGIQGNGTNLLGPGGLVANLPGTGFKEYSPGATANVSGPYHGTNYTNNYSKFNIRGNLNNLNPNFTYFSTGGGGGSAGTHDAPRHGGNGGFGSGGGGGGANTTNGTSARYAGNGGNGGPGIVIIQCI